VWYNLLHNNVTDLSFLFSFFFLFFFEATITGNLLLQEDEDETFQQTGMPSHYNNTVCDAFNDRFRGKWMGRGDPITWPLKSPDVTPINFFLEWLCYDMFCHVRMCWAGGQLR